MQKDDHLTFKKSIRTRKTVNQATAHLVVSRRRLDVIFNLIIVSMYQVQGNIHHRHMDLYIALN